MHNLDDDQFVAQFLHQIEAYYGIFQSMGICDEWKLDGAQRGFKELTRLGLQLDSYFEHWSPIGP